jgi:hypothetical protein
MSDLRLSGEALIVLNDDTAICDDCCELNAPSEPTPEVDFGKFPMGRTTRGECPSCGVTLPRRSGGRRRSEP